LDNIRYSDSVSDSDRIDLQMEDNKLDKKLESLNHNSNGNKKDSTNVETKHFCQLGTNSSNGDKSIQI